MTRGRGDRKTDPAPAAATRSARVGTREPSAALANNRPALPPITHQPIVGISLVLIAAALGQLAVWLVSARLPMPALAEAGSGIPSSLVANPLPIEAMQSLLELMRPDNPPDRRIIFRICLVMGLLSTVAWYLVARELLGASWAMWVGIAWGVNPLFAFPVQRGTPLTLVMLAVPTVWALLLWWSRYRRRRVAFAAGTGAGLASLAALATTAAFVVSLPLLLASLRRRRKRWQGVGLLLAGFSVPVVCALWLLRTGTIESPRAKFTSDLVMALDTNDGSIMARAMRAQAAMTLEDPAAGHGFCWGAVWREIKRSPAELPAWVGGRAWRCLYATSDGRFQRPLFVLNIAVLLPALWGMLVCLRQTPWRWQAASCIVLLGAFWLMAAFVEPLARNLAPVGGVLVIFNLTGLADLYEHAFGRRLNPPAGWTVRHS